MRSNPLIHCLAILLLLLAGSGAWAKDEVVLKNGRTYNGEIISETEDLVTIRVKISGIEQLYHIFIDDIQTITRDVAASSEEASVKAPTADRAHPRPGASDEGTPADQPDLTNKKVFVIPMIGGVGQTFRADKLLEAVDAARPYNPDVIVLKIDSPGGSVAETMKLVTTLQELRDEFRIVVWVKSAISAAAMTSLNVRDIYFMNDGHMGAATALYFGPSGPTAVQGEELERLLEWVRDFATSGGYDAYLAQAMVSPDYWLTADRVVLGTGEVRVTFYDSDQGQYVLSRPGEVLTITASQAEYFRISLGTYDQPEDLARALNLDGWVEVSDAGRRIMNEWIRAWERAEVEIPRLYREYQNAASSVEDRIRVVNEFLRWLRRYPAIADNFAMQPLDGTPFPLNERSLVRLRERLVRERR